MPVEIVDRRKRVEVKEQPPGERARNFEEVSGNYSEEEAIKEAKRCLKCKTPMCVEGCPVGVNIPKFVGEIVKGDFDAAIRTIKDKNSLPAICGRVCPQEQQCEKLCILNMKWSSLAIGKLEKFAADHEMEAEKPTIPERNGKKVAVVGSGPAGLTVAGELARMGYEITLFEALHTPGGVLVYGIPEFRLPKRIVEREVEYVKSLGVDIRLNTIVGKTLTIDDIFGQGYSAIFIGSGAGLPSFLGIPGESLNGVYSANEFLTRVNLMKAYLFPEYATPIKRGKNVAVIGGGNVALDAARTALRLGAEHVYLLYRRGRREMPGRSEEVIHAEEEGIEFMLLSNPVRIVGEGGKVTGIEYVKMELGEPDESGRSAPIPVKGSETTIPVDTVIVAIGTSPNPLIPKMTVGIDVTGHGNLIVDGYSLMTSREGVFAGGDIVSGSATVISAMGQAKEAAANIDQYIKGKS